MPKIAGTLAKSHFQEGFRQRGFIDTSLQKWQPARRQSDTAGGASARYEPLLSSRQRLYRSIAFSPGEGLVRIYSPLPYAEIHNESCTLSPSVTAKMRKFIGPSVTLTKTIDAKIVDNIKNILIP